VASARARADSSFGVDGGSRAARVPIHLSKAQEALIGVTFGTVKVEDADAPIEAVGTIALDERKESYVQLRAPGWIQAVFANETWAPVHQGDPLFAIYSPEIETDEQSYLSSLREYVALAPDTAPRVRQGAASIVNAAIDRLRYIGVSDRELRRLSRGGAASGQIEIDAPTNGIIIERNAFPNMYAGPSTRLYTVADLSDVWVYAPVFQARLGMVKPGEKVKMSLDTYPGETFNGAVDFILPQIDQKTRAGRVRCAFDNAGGLLKLGMFGRIIIEAPLGRALVAPASGVLRTGASNIAFVDDGGGNLRPVALELGPRVSGGFIIERGLRAGDRIVTSADFLVDAESQSEAAMSAAAVATATPSTREAPPPPATMVVQTNPARMRRGKNTVKVALRDALGRPIRGASVSIVMYMPPMPSMGMAAMRVESRALADDSGYAATIDLPAGGSWLMTIAASKHGHELAREQRNVSAGGSV
jgi:RND family efflux transporter MFP subunit